MYVSTSSTAAVLHMIDMTMCGTVLGTIIPLDPRLTWFLVSDNCAATARLLETSPRKRNGPAFFSEPDTTKTVSWKIRCGCVYCA